MQVLAIDIGLGTSDLLLYDSKEKNPENYLKLILPSPTKYFSRQVSSLKGDIFVGGYTVGGGLINKALKRHLKGNKVFISKEASKTISDDISEVKADGFLVVEDVLHPDIFLKEVDKEVLYFIESRCQCNIDKVLIAAQDHGFRKGVSDREVRIEFLKSFLKNGLKSAKFEAEDIIPENFTRWNSLKKQFNDFDIKNFAISDTSVVAALGAAFCAKKFPVITVDVGNGHTFAAIVDENYNVSAFLEHHTSKLTTEKLISFLKKMVDYNLSHNEIFDDKGHGAHTFFKIENISYDKIDIFVTGPRREELFCENDRVKFANPFGDVMITGCVGLLMQQSLV
ncbi:hypothetical protein FHQ18_01305 [Deferribacter autotrophicus]|uniref:Pyruvate formate lyase-activating protein n=1 Tax=Deferribacter autotrophicus TaxID=500465 RepID=A0A5A8F7H6_9BACT|nr:DUF1786 family protein [Deferribacter autotrophicus]KAA0259543.1 hypothetical protein FHQ18_01305 [Deferribacter autotrophicus]